jgi:hypothetical protein
VEFRSRGLLGSALTEQGFDGFPGVAGYEIVAGGCWMDEVRKVEFRHSSHPLEKMRDEMQSLGFGYLWEHLTELLGKLAPHGCWHLHSRENDGG